MAKKYRGDPILTLRLPAWQIAGLKMIAKREQATVSALIRAQVEELLVKNGISAAADDPIEGQICDRDLICE